jgi:hypothetical protein
VHDVRRGKPDFDEAAERARSHGSLVPVLVVLGFGVTLVVGLIALTGLAGIYIILALTGMLLFAATHYVLWGWWLTNKLRQQDESEREDP